MFTCKSSYDRYLSDMNEMLTLSFSHHDHDAKTLHPKAIKSLIGGYGYRCSPVMGFLTFKTDYQNAKTLWLCSGAAIGRRKLGTRPSDADSVVPRHY